MMNVLDLQAGSKEWLEIRMESCAASEAPIVMGCIDFMSRNQLLDLKKGWIKNPLDSFTKKLFQKGHDFESDARLFAENYLFETLPPVVGIRIVDGLDFIASFDGLSESGLPWENKSPNKTLVENIRNGKLEPKYYWQLEHQALVAGSDQVIFSVSDGTEENTVFMDYNSLPDRRISLIAGWKQFQKDLDNHIIKAKEDHTIVGHVETFPLISVSVDGAIIDSNFDKLLEFAQSKYMSEFDKRLETEKDLKDAALLAITIGKTEKAIKNRIEDIRATQFSFAEFCVMGEQLIEIFSKLRINRNNAVKHEKNRLKIEIFNAATEKFNDFILEQNKLIKPLSVFNFYQKLPNFNEIARGRNSLKNIHDAVDSELSRFKAEVTAAIEQAVLSIKAFRDNNGNGKYEFLFNDWVEICKNPADVVAIIAKSRIAEYKEARKKLFKDELEKIRLEEEFKSNAKIELIKNKIKELNVVKVEVVQEKKLHELKTESLPKDGTQFTVFIPVVIHWEEYKPKSIQVKHGKSGRWVDDVGKLFKFDPHKLEKA